VRGPFAFCDAIILGAELFLASILLFGLRLFYLWERFDEKAARMGWPMSDGGIRSGTLHLSDEDFVREFESCELAGASFHHADHVRLTWIYVREFGESVATERVLAGILQFATHSGSPKKFHFTQTCAWVRLIAAARGDASELATFLEFIAAHQELLDANALARYYSKTLLDSPAARSEWVEPDIGPLPSACK
jgi:hypothetical protein